MLPESFDVSVSTSDDAFAPILSYAPSSDGVYVFDGLLTATAVDGSVYVARGAGAFKSWGGVASQVGAGDGWARDYIFDAAVLVYGLRVVGAGSSIEFQVKGAASTALDWRLRLAVGPP